MLVLTFLRSVFLRALDMLPSHSGLVDTIALHSELTSEARLVILLRLVLLDLLYVVPTHGRLEETGHERADTQRVNLYLVFAVILHPVFPAEALGVVLLRGVLAELLLVVVAYGRLVHAVLLDAELSAVAVRGLVALRVQLLLLRGVVLVTHLLAERGHAGRNIKWNKLKANC